MVYLAISLLLIVPYILLLSYYRKSWLSIPEPDDSGNNDARLPTISVIVPARNEEHNIEHCLNSLALQDYPSHLFEVIVIDDHSEDRTAEIVDSFSKSTPFVHLIKLSEHTDGKKLNSYKKKAIAAGLQFSKGILIATTDADCTVPEKWLRTLGTSYLRNHPAMIAAPVRFDIPAAKNIFQKLFFIFQSLDFMTLQGITGAAIHKKMHYMANGANLAYTKHVFESINGFEGIDKIASGDDMLLMEKIGFEKNIQYLKSKEAIVSTNPEPTINKFFNQRIRWASKSSTYSDKKIKWVLALVYLVNVWLLVTVVGVALFKIPLNYFLILFIIKIFVDLAFLIPVGNFFDQRKLVWWLIIFEPLHILYIIIAGWLGALGSYSWKGRRVK